MSIRSICFVCLGNICRSPLAEGVARHVIESRGLDLVVASAGTGDWHVGEPPDRRMQETAKRFGIDISRQRADNVTPNHVRRFDLFVAMDDSNRRNMQAILGRNTKIVRLLDYHPGPESEVPDPYYGGPEGFDLVYRLVWSGVSGLLDAIVAEKI